MPVPPSRRRACREGVAQQLCKKQRQAGHLQHRAGRITQCEQLVELRAPMLTAGYCCRDVPDRKLYRSSFTEFAQGLAGCLTSASTLSRPSEASPCLGSRSAPHNTFDSCFMRHLCQSPADLDPVTCEAVFRPKRQNTSQAKQQSGCEPGIDAAQGHLCRKCAAFSHCIVGFVWALCQRYSTRRSQL